MNNIIEERKGNMDIIDGLKERNDNENICIENLYFFGFVIFRYYYIFFLFLVY